MWRRGRRVLQKWGTKLEKKDVRAYSPLTLAFLGDAAYETLVREKLVKEANMPVGRLHRLSVERVKAKYQAEASDRILPLLTDEEMIVFKRGRNAHSGSVPKSAGVIEYRKATALETLFGYLHLLGDSDRIDELFSQIWPN